MEWKLGDCALHYEERGQGEPLVLLHGNGEDLSYFKAQMEYFSKKYRVIAVDTRGHGRSGRGSAPFCLGQFREDLFGFLTGLGLGRIHLLGFSDGANIALLFALKYPGQVESLILNGGNLRPSGVKLHIQAGVVAGWAMTGLLSPFLKDCKRKRELLGLMVKEPHISGRDLAGLTMPVLVIAGDKDMIRESHTREIAAGIRGSRLAILSGDHFIAAKEPEAFNRAVGDFLDAVRALRSGEAVRKPLVGACWKRDEADIENKH